ncbi:MAG: Heavy metal efflux outer membrane protein CzcC family [Polyangiaceae bacterium]|jgi:cobalt-zinc-cadmium efflux system outer membrane protein|nr:Heavy metal efflux outer membrane protein CzcC family [Polyangiaceae bacterium]
MGRWLPCFALALLFSANSEAAAPSQELSETRNLCRAGVDRNVADATRLRGSAAVSASRVLPNPKLVVEHQRALTGVAERETVVGLSVPLGVSGRRWLLQDVATAREQAAKAEARASLFEAAVSFREAYALAVVDQAHVDARHEAQSFLDALATLVQGLARGGEAAGYDSLRQSSESRSHRRHLEAALARAASSRALLEAWLGEGLVLSADLAQLGQLAGGPAVDRLSDAPAVQQLLAAAHSEELEARAARRRAVPDLELFAGYRSVRIGGEPGQGFSVSLQLPVTLFDRGQGQAAQAEAARRTFAAQASQLRQRHRAQLKAHLAMLDRLEAAFEESAAANAEASVVREKATRLYAAGEATITELLEAHRAAEEAKLAHIALAQDIALSRLALMRAAGSMFDKTLDRECRDGPGALP